MTSIPIDPRTAWRAVGRASSEEIVVAELSSDGSIHDSLRLAPRDLPAVVANAPGARWVWSDSAAWYPALLATGVRVDRARDLRLCHAILDGSELVMDAAQLRAAREWITPPRTVTDDAPTLFELDTPKDAPEGIEAVVAEFRRQQAAVRASRDPRRLDLLLAAESAGALIAEELHAAGVPWDAATHDRLLRDALGERPAGGGIPARMAELAASVREALGDATASLDSQPRLLRSLRRAGIPVETTSRWELAEHDHPAIAPLREYKRLSRLQSANGWTWLAQWVRDGRFRPVYVPGGVVTGRWASQGGGALQLPRQLRPSVRADPGWILVVADVAQLEPRVLAAIAGDHAMADAARGQDLYEGIVASGAVSTRAEAKIATLGALYGSTTGESGRLVPALRRAFPRAMALVDDAARAGEEGRRVSTWLGRTSPSPESDWLQTQAQAADAEATDADQARARRGARDRGRFTRNFIVQGTAAEWALCWLAATRRRLAALPPVADANAAPRSGSAFAQHPHLAFFLHDEIIVHTPAQFADEAAAAVRDAAAEAGRLLFGDFPIDFPLDLRVAESAEK